MARRDGGRLYAFEGVDGSGKSTLARLVAEALRGLGREVVTTREPGGTALAEEVRSVLMRSASDAAGPPDALATLLLFEAARADHVARVVRPALERGAVVLTDRYVGSTRVYQGGCLGGVAGVRALHAALGHPEPDGTFLLDLDPTLAAARASARGEAAGAATVSRIATQRDRFLALAASERGWTTLDGTRAAVDNAAAVAGAIGAALA